jgi:hypothetical protein
VALGGWRFHSQCEGRRPGMSSGRTDGSDAVSEERTANGAKAGTALNSEPRGIPNTARSRRAEPRGREERAPSPPLAVPPLGISRRSESGALRDFASFGIPRGVAVSYATIATLLHYYTVPYATLPPKMIIRRLSRNLTAGPILWSHFGLASVVGAPGQG